MSVNIISLNQIVDLFSGFADRHYFLNDFGFGATSEIGTSRQMDFPYMWVTLNENSVINPQNRTAIPELSFSVLFMDKTNIQSNYLEINGDNSDNIQEILSDMLQVLQDFVTEVQVDWGNYGIIFQDNINCFPATDETQDKVNGWVGQFSFKLKHSNCILPTGDITQTNLSPINPMTRYLTCDTVTACTSLQQYVAQQISGITGGTGDLQIVTDNGNTTTNDIQLLNAAELIFGAGGGVLLDNTSRLREGTIDAGTGGSKGIAQICAVGYELKWEAGSLYVMNGNGNIIREVRYTFTNTPTVNDDVTKGFTTGSRWVLDDGDVYVCSDPTTAAAVWNLQQGNVNYYGSFSFSGNQTGNSGVVLTMSADTEDSWNNGISLSGGTKFMIDNAGVYNIQFSSQMLKSAGNNSTHIHIWLSQNGTDVPNSATQVGFPSNSVYQVPSWNWFIETTTPNEYVELKWEINSNVNNAVTITSQPISGNVPSIPGNIITINKVS
jgi:hypothetical protein